MEFIFQSSTPLQIRLEFQPVLNLLEQRDLSYCGACDLDYPRSQVLSFLGDSLAKAEWLLCSITGDYQIIKWELDKPSCYFDSVTTVLFIPLLLLKMSSLRLLFLLTLIVSILSAGKRLGSFSKFRGSQRKYFFHRTSDFLPIMMDVRTKGILWDMELKAQRGRDSSLKI